MKDRLGVKSGIGENQEGLDFLRGKKSPAGLGLGQAGHLHEISVFTCVHAYTCIIGNTTPLSM